MLLATAAAAAAGRYFVVAIVSAYLLPVAAGTLRANAVVCMGAAMLEDAKVAPPKAAVVLAVAVAQAARDARVGFASDILVRVRRMDSKVDYYGYL